MFTGNPRPVKSRFDLKKEGRATLARLFAASNLYRLWARGKVFVLMYHRVLTSADRDKYYVQPGMYVDRESFSQQMQYVNSAFDVLPLMDILGLVRRKELDQGKRYCAITFDDGWRDNYTHAFPILKREGLPATLFLAASFIGTDNWDWPDTLGYLLKQYLAAGSDFGDRFLKYPWLNKLNDVSQIDRAIEEVKNDQDIDRSDLIARIQNLTGIALPRKRLFLNWEEIEEMGREGISFGVHTDTHSILTRLTDEMVRQEMTDCRTAIQSHSLPYTNILCYPNGSYNDRVVLATKESGFEGAVTTQFGYWDNDTVDTFRLKRIPVHNDITSDIDLFKFHIFGCNRMAKKLKKRV